MNKEKYCAFIKRSSASNDPTGVLAETRTTGENIVNISSSKIDFGTTWPIPGHNEVLVVTLGGVGRIGMNWTLYGHDGHWILVDAGIAFPDRGDEDIDFIAPDPRALAPIMGSLKGIIVTHAHEDHIGAVAKFWPHHLNCPIYASPFASAILKHRFTEAGTLRDVRINTFGVGKGFDVGRFHIDSVLMTHSVPEPLGLAIRTKAGTVFHSGDFKFDPDPLVGQSADIERLKAIGDGGVLAMLADSTNAHISLPQTSEGSVRRAFRKLFETRTGMVVVCCFASNVARVSSVIDAAAGAGREIALAGRSMETFHDAARSLGLLKGVPEPLARLSHLRGLDRRQMAIACTGTQGEERATLSRIARGEFRFPDLGAGDTIIMSSRVIPGNEEIMQEIVNRLERRGIEVIRSNTVVDGDPVHVTGHPGRDELAELYGYIKPKFSVPVHGEVEHQNAHKAIALEAGVDGVVLMKESEVTRLTKGSAHVVGQVHAPLLSLSRDGAINLPPQDSVRLTA